MAKVQTEWNRTKIANLLATSDKAVERALIVIFNNQEADEQVMDSTHKANGVGFTAFDADIFSSFAKHILKGRSLSVKQMEIARKKDKFGNMKIAKYWKQLQAEIVRKEQKLDIPADGGFRTSKQVINGVEQGFTYDDDTYSDFFKDAHGFRPHGILWDQWMAKTPVEKQKHWDRLQEEIKEAIERDKKFNHCLQKEVDNFVNYSGNWNSTNGKRNLNEWE